MSNRLAVLLVPIVLLGLGYFVYTKLKFDKKAAVVPFEISDYEPGPAGSGDPSEAPDGEGLDPEAPEAVGIVPDIHVAEFPGRRLVVSGRMSTADERAKVLEAIKADLGESFVVDDQVKLDHQCDPFEWGSKVDDLDFTEVQKVRRFDLQITNTVVTLRGEVFSAGASKNVSTRVKANLPNEVRFEDQLSAVERPLASFSVWAAPDRTFLLSGNVPEGAMEKYVKLIQNAMPGMAVINDLIEDRFVETPEWEKQVQAFLPGFLRSTQRAGLKIDEGNHVKLEGLVESKTLASMRKRLQASFPKPKYALQIDLQLGMPTEIKVATPDPSKAPSRPVARTVREMIGTTKVFFRSGRSRVNQLNSSEVAKLDRLGRQWRKENFNQKVYVFGFTDSSGDPGTNAYFSKTRCDNVVGYLRKTYNLDGSFFEVIGTPPNYPKESGSANELRRVEFSLTDQPSQPPVVNWAATGKGPTNVLKPIVTSDLFSKSKEIFFGSGKVSPSKEDRESLFHLGSALALEKSQEMIIIYGYGDSKGKAAANKWFTEERCKAVRKELVRGGVASDRIIMRPILAAKVASGSQKKTNGDKDEVETVNPRRVMLVKMDREAYDKEEAEKKAAKEAAFEAEKKAAEEPAEPEPNSEAAPGEADGGAQPVAEETITPGEAFNASR